jgi:c-di-GMP-related signal transduction protein
MDVLVARQAILDRQQKLYGYELLFRSNPHSNAFDGTEAAAATMQVLSNTLMSIGAEKLLGGKKAFVNFDHRLLLDNMHLTLPRDSLVIEILETVVPTDDLLALCQKIQEQGYTLALDDFTDPPGLAPLARTANVIKIDMRLSSREEQKRMLLTYKPQGVMMLAEKVETDAEFQWALHAGYDLFQGYFFARPMVVKSQQIPAVKTACLRLIREAQQRDLDFTRIERLIREDVSLTYQLLRYANSALFQRHTKFESITHALLVLGEGHIRRWVALVTLPMLATNKPGELVKLSLVRASFCERLAQRTEAPSRPISPNNAFLTGMFSLLNALIDQPLEEALHGLELGKDVLGAILENAPEEDTLAQLLQLIRCYERGDWPEVDRLAERCGIAPAAVGDAYLEASSWADQTAEI